MSGESSPTQPLLQSPKLAEFFIPHKIVVNDETYLPERSLIAALAVLYRADGGRHMLAVATLCDDYLDPTGRLLGRIRQQADSG